jgi:hypothetical protein
MKRPSAYFSANTTEADAKFSNAARAAGATLTQVRHPLPGPAGEALFMSFARVGAPKAKKVLLVLSGTHGCEGFAGAAVQTGLLENHEALLAGGAAALVFVHLVNPWGMAWSRREDHENIDLFRNFHYHDDPIQPDPLFDVVDDAMDLPHYAQHSAEHKARVRSELIAQHGSEARLIAAIRRGQHHRPRSQMFHGTAPAWSLQVLRETLPPLLAGCRQLVVVDVHTGFGGYGVGTVMSYDAPGDPRHERIKRWMGGTVYTPGMDADIPAHPKSPFGFIADWVPGVKVTAAILEYGTFPPEETRDVFPLNHYYHVYGDPRSPAGREVGKRYRRFCYPEEPKWMGLVWARGYEVARCMMGGLLSWSRG